MAQRKTKQDVRQWQAALPRHQRKILGTISGIVAIIISVLLAWTSWWFIETITIKQAFGGTPSESWVSALVWLIPFGLLLAAITSAVGALFIAFRHSRSVDMLIFASKVAIIFLVVTAVNVLFVTSGSSLEWFSTFVSNFTNFV